jgi:hypothetical protein
MEGRLRRSFTEDYNPSLRTTKDRPLSSRCRAGSIAPVNGALAAKFGAVPPGLKLAR